MDRVGQYRVLGELGRGGAGVVLHGQGPRGEEVAIKLLHSGRGADERSRRRFAREAEALARLDHPRATRTPVACTERDPAERPRKERPWLAAPAR
ncbi:MAG TPA: hypothetical protein DEA08_10720 [Planctomycetes bacterium]|nr:hypothetical protein [Planctomycetota bacterium]